MTDDNKTTPEEEALLTAPEAQHQPKGRKGLRKKRNPTGEAIQQLQDLIHNLPPEVQEQMARMGVVLPAGDVSAALEGKFRWGLRCAQCNQIALYFVGTKFVDLHTNEEFDEPQPHMTVQQLPWTQRLPADKINRHAPKCQNCAHPVELQGDNCFRFQRRLIEVENWQERRDASFSRENLRKLMRDISGMGSVATTPDGQQISLSQEVKGAARTISEFLEREMPGAVDDIRAVDTSLKAAGLGGLPLPLKTK